MISKHEDRPKNMKTEHIEKIILKIQKLYKWHMAHSEETYQKFEYYVSWAIKTQRIRARVRGKERGRIRSNVWKVNRWKYQNWSHSSSHILKECKFQAWGLNETYTEENHSNISENQRPRENFKRNLKTK